MKACLLPLAFEGRDADFATQLDILKSLLAAEADFLDPVPLGAARPPASSRSPLAMAPVQSNRRPPPAPSGGTIRACV